MTPVMAAKTARQADAPVGARVERIEPRVNSVEAMTELFRTAERDEIVHGLALRRPREQ